MNWSAFSISGTEQQQIPCLRQAGSPDAGRIRSE